MVTKITIGYGRTFQVKPFESVRAYMEVEETLAEGESPKEKADARLAQIKKWVTSRIIDEIAAH